MKKKWIISALLLFMAAFPATASGQEDLFSKNKSDTAIKPLVFPLSMAVIENRPLKGHYYFFDGDAAKFDEGLQGNPDSGDNNFHAILSDPVMIKKTLVATDPARITPSKRADDIRGPINRKVLKKISKNLSKDIVFILRREIRVIPTAALPSSLFLRPGEFFTHKWPEPNSVKIRNQGLIYLTRQNKIMMVPSNEKSKSFITKGNHVTGEDLQAGWRELAKEGLQDLADSAKKLILDKQFVIRRPTY